MHRKYLLIVLGICVLFLIGMTAWPTLRLDSGQITFLRECPDCPVRAIVQPPDCMSSSNTQPLVSRAQVVIDHDTASLVFTAQFVFIYNPLYVSGT